MITGNVAKQGAGGDGVRVKIKLNDVDFWPAGGGYATISDTSGLNVFAAVSLNANDKLQFIVDASGSIDYDATVWNPTITYY